MATLTEIQERIDTRMSSILTAISSLEEAYQNSNEGRYFQGLRTHSDFVRGESLDRSANRLNGKPIGQAESWKDFSPGLFDGNLPCNTSIDVYNGPTGWGYLVTFEHEFENRMYERVHNVGPESSLEKEWSLILE